MFELKPIGFILLTACVVLSLSSPLEPASRSFRLPGNTIPRSYSIHLEPDFEDDQMVFYGISLVNFTVVRPTTDVTVHTSALIHMDKDFTTMTNSHGGIERPISQEWNPELEFFTIKFRRVLEKGDYQIEFKWKGLETINNTRILTQGLMHRNISDYDYVVATQLKPRGARSVFPCWDEPSYRAHFQISLKHQSNYTAISNMPVEKVVPAENAKNWTIFQETPAMSPHMINFVIGPYKKTAGDSGKVKVWFLEAGQEQQMQFLQELTPLMIRALEDYTGIEYPLPQLNIIYVPKYNAYFAYNHFGVLIFSDYLLYNPVSDDPQIEYYNRICLAQGVAYQWLGNLVAPAWWDDAWLSTSLPMYYGFKIFDHVQKSVNSPSVKYPFEHITIMRIMDLMTPTMRKALPVISPANNYSEVDRLILSDTPMKGISILYMLEHILTEDVMQSGLRNYFKEYKFSSATTDDLLTCLQEASNKNNGALKPIDAPLRNRKKNFKFTTTNLILSQNWTESAVKNDLDNSNPDSVRLDNKVIRLQKTYNGITRSSPITRINYDIKKIIEPWLKQTGYPLLNVTKDYKTGIVTITQSDAVDPESKNRWTIPITYATSSQSDISNATITNWLHSSHKSLQLFGVSKDDWIILNPQMHDAYQIVYDHENWKRIAAYLNTDNYDKIPILNRLMILNHANKLSYDVEQDVELTIEILSYLSREKNIIPFLASQSVLNILAPKLINTPEYEPFRRFSLDLMKSAMSHIRIFEHRQDNKVTEYLKRQIINMACRFGYKDCKRVAVAKFIDAINNKNLKMIAYDERKWTYCTAVSVVNETVWASAVEAFQENPKEMLELYAMLGCTKNQKLIRKYLTMALNSVTTNSSDAFDNVAIIFESLRSGPAEQYNFALDLLLENANKIRQYYKIRENPTGWATLIESMMPAAKTLDDEAKMTKLIEQEASVLDNAEESIRILKKKVKSSGAICKAFAAVFKKKFHLHHG